MRRVKRTRAKRRETRSVRIRTIPYPQRMMGKFVFTDFFLNATGTGVNPIT